jgi:hypothetical protein
MDLVTTGHIVGDVRRRRSTPCYKEVIMTMGTGTRMGTTEATTEAQEHSEGVVARTIEEQTAKIPSDVYLWAAGASMAASLFLQMAGKKHTSLFIGQWAPSFLILGLYNKVVKVAGSDRTGR